MDRRETRSSETVALNIYLESIYLTGDIILSASFVDETMMSVISNHHLSTPSTTRVTVFPRRVSPSPTADKSIDEQTRERRYEMATPDRLSTQT